VSFANDTRPPIDWRLSLALIAVIVGAFAFLAYGPGLESAYAGFGALFAIPFAVGALWVQATRIFSILGCLGAPLLLLALSALLVRIGAEGLVCVAMVMPVWILAGIGGGLMALWMRRQGRREAGAVEDFDDGSRLRAFGLAVLPFALIFAEQAAPPAWQEREVVRTIAIDAPPSAVWPHMVSIPRIEPQEGKATFTHDWLGIPRPSAASLQAGPSGSVRVAKWGPHIRFEEHIVRRAEGRTLAWRFAFPDDSVQRYTDRHVSPDGPMLKIVSGRYLLMPNANGGSTLTLATRYRMRTRLGWYFAWWGEVLLGDVSENVLAVVKSRAARVRLVNSAARELSDDPRHPR
jgi:hypothetical protein